MVGVANRAKRAEELGALAAESPDEPAAYITGLSEGIEICAECLAEGTASPPFRDALRCLLTLINFSCFSLSQKANGST